MTGLDGLVLTAHPTNGTILVAKHTSTLQVRQLDKLSFNSGRRIGFVSPAGPDRAASIRKLRISVYVLGDKGVGE